MQTKKNKPKQGKEKKKTKTQKNPCLQLYTQSQGSGGYLPGNKGLCRDGGVGVGCVCVCVCVCVQEATCQETNKGLCRDGGVGVGGMCVCIHSLCKSVLHRMGT